MVQRTVFHTSDIITIYEDFTVAPCRTTETISCIATGLSNVFDYSQLLERIRSQILIVVSWNTTCRHHSHHCNLSIFNWTTNPATLHHFFLTLAIERWEWHPLLSHWKSSTTLLWQIDKLPKRCSVVLRKSAWEAATRLRTKNSNFIKLSKATLWLTSTYASGLCR